MSTRNGDSSSTAQSTTAQSTTAQPAGGLPVDDDGKRVYPNDAANSDAGGQTAAQRSYHGTSTQVGG